MLDAAFQFLATRNVPATIKYADQGRYGFRALKTASAPEFGASVKVADRELIPVRFSFDAEPGLEALLHLNSITDRNRTDISALRMDEVLPGLYQLILLLPAAFTASYRYAVADEIPNNIGVNREGWLWVHSLGQIDPHNPDVLRNPLGATSSVLTMPETPLHPAWSDYAESTLDTARQNSVPLETNRSDGSAVVQDLRAGQNVQTVQNVQILAAGKPRRAWTFSNADDPDKLLVLFDGEMWMSLQIQKVLQRIKSHKLAVVVVASDTFAEREKMLTDLAALCELLTSVHAGSPDWFGKRFAARDTILSGQSYGGLAAATLVLAHPELARQAIAQSGSYWYGASSAAKIQNGAPHTVSEEVAALLQVQPAEGTKLVLQAGSEETEMAELSQIVHTKLTDIGFSEVSLQIFPGGHDYAWWRHGLLIGLDTLTEL